jgi:Ras family protein T1
LITLTPKAYQELTRLFQRFDLNNDGLLSLEELTEAFSLCFDIENPFARINQDYLSITATEDGKMTIDGWLSLWTLATLQNPYSILKCFIRWGYKQRLGQYLNLKKLRKYRKSPADYPNIINAYVFGALRSGKTSIMQNLIGSSVNEEVYCKTHAQTSVVNVVESEQGKPYYLALTEFEDSEILSVLESEHIMEKCDVAVMVFDGSDALSFSYLAKLQQKLDPNIPCAYVLAKHDLPLVDQTLDVSPEVFCEELGLPWPPILHSAVEYDPETSQSFEDILYFALNPDVARPHWKPVETDVESDTEEEETIVRGKSSLFIRTIKIIGTLSVLSFGAALLWKYVSKPQHKDEPAKQSGK